MSRLISGPKRPYHKDELIFNRKKIEIIPGVTVLVGCNGTGKTTLLYRIRENLKSFGIPHRLYDNLLEGGNSAKQASLFNDRVSLLATLATSSEGEQILINLGNAAQRIGEFCSAHKGATELWILLDALDSGLSIDNIIDIKKLFHTIIETNPNSEVYIVVAANTFEMCLGEKCLDVRNGTYREFKSYDAYRNFILRSRDHKDTRVTKK